MMLAFKSKQQVIKWQWRRNLCDIRSSTTRQSCSSYAPARQVETKSKKIRQKKEQCRVNAKKKAIKYLNKRKAEMLLKDHINNQKIDPPIQEDQPKIAELYLVINKNLFKKKERYRRKANQNALRVIRKARKSCAKLN